MPPELFPRSADRGPIEAVESRTQAPCYAPFPRSADRGPIEARKLFASRSYLRAYFRDQLIAAPLKRRRRRRLCSTAAHFRDQLIAAPLKHELVSPRS